MPYVGQEATGQHNRKGMLPRDVVQAHPHHKYAERAGNVIGHGVLESQHNLSNLKTTMARVRPVVAQVSP